MSISREQYFEYFNIINNNNFSERRRKGLFSILNVCASTYENIDFREVEDLCYDDGVSLLSDREKIMYELNYISKCINGKNEKFKKQLSSIYSDFLMGEDEEEIKKRITLLQCDLGVDAQFISVFPMILEDLKENKNYTENCAVNNKTFNR